MTALPDPASFLSGESGGVFGPRLTVTRTASDLAKDLVSAVALTGPRLDRLAARQRPLDVLVVSIYRPGSELPGAIRSLRSERHRVGFALGATGAPDPALREETVADGMRGGKFENLNEVLAAAPAVAGFDWLIAVDDDVGLPRRFLDRYLALCERLGFDLAQPAQSMRSHAAWRVTRRRALSLARRTQYVEIGPLTAFRREVATDLTPFPALRFGWGLDNHWGALARERGWRLGIVDCLPVRHESGVVAATYGHEAAIEEGRRYLAGKPYLRTEEAQRTLATVRRVPS